MKKIASLLIIILTITSCNSQDKKQVSQKSDGKKIVKSEAEWKKELTPDQYDVLRMKGTERPFTGEYTDNFEKGTYVCAACGNVLFNSNAKFKSECGWPSFDQAIKGSVEYTTDNSLGMSRTEVTCAKCGGHLGHVFDDGPIATTGKRFCTNSVSIKFIPAK
ncbi:peptide-methionine (R)-S-oxide reductase MsrB [Flavobacterium silvaticum]|uniref:peptide-methionine (R)-S-oxide reductase n=1 Tax=Flavobacterium silvaticum TaxID=1852020 RepID=A0A972FWZ3_9FLAO|nr:peptide-methionine (R)-S-oxide reductase MsrB [Flavobacterium silvaticum]NMH29180.1 peptide-methionine (R)-S-oxide reductase MsrB [Flavobacterium silvaticum]